MVITYYNLYNSKVQSHSVTPSIFFHRVSATCPTILFFGGTIDVACHPPLILQVSGQYAPSIVAQDILTAAGCLKQLCFALSDVRVPQL